MFIVWIDPHVCSIFAMPTINHAQHVFSHQIRADRRRSLANRLAVCGSKPNGAVLFSKVNKHMLQICCIEILTKCVLPLKFLLTIHVSRWGNEAFCQGDASQQQYNP